ncbi:MAG: hypothetical protein H6599_10435 [Flavobacteriales bacterium]|nr:hypothetical protein [Flavobacteriales bacterium]
MFFVPGEMVGLWFDFIPSEKPYFYGDGYPILPTLKGHEYVDYNKELYPLIRPKYAERGLHGSVNVATFVREYANFGYPGLILSSLFLAVFLYFLEKLFADSLTILISMNLIYLLLLSSSNLFTILFSGGWLVLISLYFIFKSTLLKSVQSK